MRHDAARDVWEPFTVDEVAALLRSVPGLWWLSGGVALDEFLGVTSRVHGDIDVSVVRADFPAMSVAIRSALRVWTARDGDLQPLLDDAVPAAVDNLWAKVAEVGPWKLQLNLEDIERGTWSYRRDRRITLPVDRLVWQGPRMRCVRPHVQLLWKAADPRASDELDYDATIGRLSPEDRRWLGGAIRLAHPRSPWATRPELNPA